MNRLCRIVAVWILMLALPLQGTAASAMPGCASSPSHSMPASMMEHHHGIVPDGHAMHAAHAVMHDGHQHDRTQGHHACSTCAACCIGAAVATASMDWSLPPLAVFHLPQPDAIVSGIIPVRLERPPRLA